jgi:hypothetical protein
MMIFLPEFRKEGVYKSRGYSTSLLFLGFSENASRMAALGRHRTSTHDSKAGGTAQQGDRIAKGPVSLARTTSSWFGAIKNRHPGGSPR